jgi:hypothetical protein
MLTREGEEEAIKEIGKAMSINTLNASLLIITQIVLQTNATWSPWDSIPHDR